MYFMKMSFVTTDTAAAKGIVVAAAAVTTDTAAAKGIVVTVATAVRSKRLLPNDVLASEGNWGEKVSRC